MKNYVEMLLASREELEKCKTKDANITDHTINQIYTMAALKAGIQHKNAYEELMLEVNGV